MVNIINPVMMLLMLFYLTTVETSDNFFSFSVKQGEKIVPLSHYAGKTSTDQPVQCQRKMSSCAEHNHKESSVVELILLRGPFLKKAYVQA
uniref:Uncharacterized protein n=1 Tax=Magallana gigas TaxID=29159 RepID=K1R440_MAGGI